MKGTMVTICVAMLACSVCVSEPVCDTRPCSVSRYHTALLPSLLLSHSTQAMQNSEDSVVEHCGWCAPCCIVQMQSHTVPLSARYNGLQLNFRALIKSLSHSRCSALHTTCTQGIFHSIHGVQVQYSRSVHMLTAKHDALAALHSSSPVRAVQLSHNKGDSPSDSVASHCAVE